MRKRISGATDDEGLYDEIDDIDTLIVDDLSELCSRGQCFRFYNYRDTSDALVTYTSESAFASVIFLDAEWDSLRNYIKKMRDSMISEANNEIDKHNEAVRLGNADIGSPISEKVTIGFHPNTTK
jgi:DNA/RNA-binding domain of Phe-tRNA-synthetase-like protein